jgi:Putative prokaryotic signal transducing protein
MAFAGSTVATFTLRHEAELAKLHLGASGVTAWLADEGVVGAHPFLAYAVGGIKVQVAAGDEERARAVLAEMGMGLGKDGSEGCLSCGEPMRETEQKCPKCGWTFAS